MKDTGDHFSMKVGIVGPCTAGKSTLIGLLHGSLDADFRHIAQEHSYVPSMWQRINPPDLLIFIDVSYPSSLQRRVFDWTEAEYAEQQRRLAHARAHADFYLLTDPLSAQEVARIVREFLMLHGVTPLEAAQ